MTIDAALSNGNENKLDISYAVARDRPDPLREYRSRFHIPTKADLARKTVYKLEDEAPSEESIYLCGNSLGLQPKATSDLVNAFLATWRTKAVTVHWFEHTNTPLAKVVAVDDHAAKLMAPLVGALEHEVAVMATLTANLHFAMCSFYRPSKKGEGRYKILLEGKAFPSDHFAVESQIMYHGLEPKDAMVLVEPADPKKPILTTEQICRAIDEHANELAMVLLPGIQFYTGQYLDIERITECAHSHDIIIGWDCAHAAGNVDLQLHDWNVDFAVWCTYKYLNSGPGATGGLFVHDRHGKVETQGTDGVTFRPRLSGWWGDSMSGRFDMTNKFQPRPGAPGFQVSNPSALDLASVVSSLTIFNEATIPRIRAKSLELTAYLEYLLTAPELVGPNPPYALITPSEPEARGAQISVRLEPGMLDIVLECLTEDGVTIDERKPDVIRVAPAPLYNSFVDVYCFCRAFRRACHVAVERRDLVEAVNNA